MHYHENLELTEGQKNLDICSVQASLRRHHTDTLSDDSSFQYGKSVLSQRTEAWWSFLKRVILQTWINYFKDLKESEVYSCSCFIQVEAFRFYLYASLQQVVDNMKEYLNNNKIRKSHGAERSDGRTELMLC